MYHLVYDACPEIRGTNIPGNCNNDGECVTGFVCDDGACRRTTSTGNALVREQLYADYADDVDYAKDYYGSVAPFIGNPIEMYDSGGTRAAKYYAKKFLSAWCLSKNIDL